MATKRQRNAATQIGSAAGLVGGAALGYKGVKGATRARRGAKWAQHAYKTSRKEFGNGRLSSASLAARTAPDAMKGPKSLPTLGSVGAGYVGAVGGSLAGSAGASQLADKHTRKVAKRDKPLMSEAEQRRRQKLQGKIGRTTSTLGLAGVGLAGTGALLAHKPGALAKIPKLTKDPEKLKSAAFHTGIISGGIGGVGGFNQASIYSAEARRRKTPVAKEQGMDTGYYGEQGTPLSLEEIEKAWEPTTRPYSPEGKRHQRNQNTQTGLTAASVGTGAGAGVVGAKAWGHEAKNRTPGQVKAKGLPSVKAAQELRHAKAIKGGKVAGGLAAGSAALAGGAALVHQKRKGSWRSYAKRDTLSAFGVDHSDNPSGQHHETEN